MRLKDLRIKVALLAFMFFINTIANAQFIINGSATDLGNGEYQLTPASGGKVGTVWSDQKVSLNDAFEVELELYFGTSDGGADGITFSLQPKSNTVGVSGGGLGISGITPSLITEFDTYRNGGYGDPSYDHIAITKNTVNHKSSDNLVAPIQIIDGQNNVEDGAWYNFKATWEPATQLFQVYMNGALRTFYQGDIVNTIFNGDPDVYWGFTASTGGRNNDQRVRLINTTFIDVYQCTETPNNQTFCPSTGPTAVNLSIANTQAGATYEWYDTPTKDNLLGTGTSYTTAPIDVNTDYYVLAKVTGSGMSSASTGPSIVADGQMQSIFNASQLDDYKRSFVTYGPVVIKSVDMYHVTWQNGCQADGSTKSVTIDIYKDGSFFTSKAATAICGNAGTGGTVMLDISLPTAGNYRMEVNGGVAENEFRVSQDASTYTIPGTFDLTGNTDFSGVFFNWQIEAGTAASECLLSVKAEKDCPPCATFPSVSLEAGFSYCHDGDTTITVTTNASNVLWSNGETSKTIRVTEGTFTVDVWDDPNCMAYDAVTIAKECPAILFPQDTVAICGDRNSLIAAEGIASASWTGTAPFTLINDSVIEVNLQADAEFYVANYLRLNILSDNIDFEDPTICASNCYKIVNANTVPGWSTTASDNMVELWANNFQGVQAYKGNQFMELNANMDAALYQDVTTTPGQLMGINLAHRGRGGVDVMELLAGPPGGPYVSINNYGDGESWGYYSETYRVPAGQTQTRFIFETVSCKGGPCGGSGNFLDAIEFFQLKEEFDTVYVKVNPSPMVNLGDDTTVCDNAPITLDADNPGFSYQWSTGASTQTISPTTTDSISVIVSGTGGCADTSSIKLSFNPFPTVNLGNNQTICDGDSITLDAGNAGYTFTWSTSETTQAIIAKATDSISVIVSDTIGCADTSSMKLQVNPMPIVDLGAKQTICEGDSITLDAGNDGYAFAWDNGESTQTVTLKSSMTIEVIVKDTIGCADTSAMELQI